MVDRIVWLGTLFELILGIEKKTRRSYDHQTDSKIEFGFANGPSR